MEARTAGIEMEERQATPGKTLSLSRSLEKEFGESTALLHAAPSFGLEEKEEEETQLLQTALSKASRVTKRFRRTSPSSLLLSTSVFVLLLCEGAEEKTKVLLLELPFFPFE